MSSLGNLWNSWSGGKRFVLITGVVIIAALSVGLTWWASRPRFSVLFGDLRQADAAEIATSLDSLQVPHRFADDGATILVPADAVYDTRMKLVTQGVPHGGSVGFEVFKDSDFGVTEFAQRVNYQRALQGELERTISSIAEVQSARVHLTLRRASMFEDQEGASKASVTVITRSGKSLTARQVSGIQRLIASAVDGLVPDTVVVLGPGGATLSAGTGPGDFGDEQVQIETRLRQRVDAMLSEALGPSASFAVSVDVRLNYDRVKQVRDTLVPQGRDGNGLVLRQTTRGGRVPSSPESDAMHIPAVGGDSELEFAHSHEQEEVERAPGQVERMTVGILLPVSVNPATIAKLDAVIASAIGLDTKRGDRLEIAAIEGLGRPLQIATTKVTPAVSQAIAHAAPPAAAHTWSPMQRNIALFGIAGLCFVGGMALARRRRPRRLTLHQRDKLLRDMKLWIDTPERQ